jgi:hypothetical protein
MLQQKFEDVLNSIGNLIHMDKVTVAHLINAEIIQVSVSLFGPTVIVVDDEMLLNFTLTLNKLN